MAQKDRSSSRRQCQRRFLDILLICTFQVKCTPRDLVDLTCFMESLSIVIDGFLLKELEIRNYSSLYYAPGNLTSNFCFNSKKDQ